MAGTLLLTKFDLSCDALFVRYRGFLKVHKIRIRRLTGLRRKQYTPEQLQKVKTQYYGFLRKKKLKYKFRAEFIVNMDEIPV